MNRAVQEIGANVVRELTLDHSTRPMPGRVCPRRPSLRASQTALPAIRRALSRRMGQRHVYQPQPVRASRLQSDLSLAFLLSHGSCRHEGFHSGFLATTISDGMMWGIYSRWTSTKPASLTGCSISTGRQPPTRYGTEIIGVSKRTVYEDSVSFTRRADTSYSASKWRNGWSVTKIANS